MKRNIWITLLLLLYTSIASCQINMNGIKQIIGNHNATIGVAVIHKDKIYTIGNDNKYPLMSAFKFHIAVTTLKKMEKESISLDSMAFIPKEMMHVNTYSPLRDKYPEQDIHISYKDIIRYTVSLSDNNTCDFLIDYVGIFSKCPLCYIAILIKDSKEPDKDNAKIMADIAKVVYDSITK